MNQQNIFFQIHCYGFPDKTRPRVELAGLEEYTNSVAGLIAKAFQDGRLALATTYGGMKNEDGETEAVAMKKRLIDAIRVQSRLDLSNFISANGNSTSTIGIVKLGINFAKSRPLGGAELWLVCDRARWLKTKYLAWYYGRKSGVTYRVKALKRRDTHRHSHWWYQLPELIAIILLGPERIQNKIESRRARS